ncbi:ceramide synthase 5 isoform X2 [Myotis lucifugus]|uniref:ceramide synthase 5 isoform X2 n=2 Tax=Myotis lucifugus TaxID=59463 RepID=UPI000CCC2B55|nr:ceramide synthase 5 isoform X2 [Myotis lucifugus]XP_059538898.1 ceramide synthase 5 isoform X4 [Myotis daubentonii]XP_059538899.1 ceramide synthase 5 isoform X4 [Myotis daubentonii]
MLASRTVVLISPNPMPSLKRCSYLLPSILMRKGWRACQSNWTGMSEKSNAGFAIGGIRTSPQHSLNSVKACRWRFTFYLCIFCYGIRFLWSSPWFWDTRQCWHSYPFQPLTSGLYYYYIMELAFYWSLMFSQFTDIKRKDFLIMFVHHLATIGLITFSYINNMVRVGTLVMCLHDASDFLLEAAKLANYAKYQRLCDTLFVIFSAVFMVTRLGIYPFWILNTTLFESWEMIGPYPSWWLFNGLLLILQVLHVIWSYLIARIAFKALIRGKVSKDDRSDVESSSEEEDVTTNTKSFCGSSSSNGANWVNGHMGGSCWAEE